MIDRLQPILALLDEGLSLYRRNFVGFVLIAASWFVPVAIATGLVIAADAWVDEFVAIVVMLGAFVLLFPLLIYLVGGLSRAAIMAAEGQPVRFRTAMAISPLRAFGMGCFTIIYYILAQIVSSAISMLCICPVFIFGSAAVGAMASVSSGAGAVGAVGITLLVLFFIVFYAFALTISGATYSSLIYGLQPWIQESRPFGQSIQRSFDLIGYRFWRNALVWGLAAVLVAAVGVSVAMTIGLLLPLPLIYALGAESTVAQAVSASAWMIGFVVVLPPLPIWMALLYRRNRAAYEGADLNGQVQAWWQAHFGEPTTDHRPPTADHRPPTTEGESGTTGHRPPTIGSSGEHPEATTDHPNPVPAALPARPADQPGADHPPQPAAAQPPANKDEDPLA